MAKKRERGKKENARSIASKVVDTVCRSGDTFNISFLTRMDWPVCQWRLFNFHLGHCVIYSELHFTYTCTIRNELSDSENLHLLRILLQFVLNVQKKMERETYSKISMVSRDRKRRNFQFLAAINPRRDVGPGIRRRRGKRKKKNKRAIRERVYPGMASWKTVIPWIRSADIQSNTFSPPTFDGNKIGRRNTRRVFRRRFPNRRCNGWNIAICIPLLFPLLLIELCRYQWTEK